MRELCELGIDQFLDPGSSIPTVGNVHGIAHRTNPGARVAYVDIEPVVVSHAENMLRGTALATTTRADMRLPEQVLNAPGVAGLLDFTRPVAVLAVAILDIISVRDPRGMPATYRDACAPGSALAVTNGAQLAVSDAERAGIDQVMSGTTTPHVTFRAPRRSGSCSRDTPCWNPASSPAPPGEPPSPSPTRRPGTPTDTPPWGSARADRWRTGGGRAGRHGRGPRRHRGWHR